MGTIYLPNEIIDLIASKFSSTLEVHDLLACSLISRQWRDVVAPHLFRYILISPYSISRRIILGFGFSGFVGIARSLETTLVVTEHLQTLHIQNFMLSLPSLHSLLSHLSSLQNLIVEEINLCDTDSTGLEGPISRLAIPNISIASINEDYPRYHQLAQFLALFSDIGQLSVIDYISASSSWEATRSTVMDAVAGSRVGELQVRTLNLGYGECARLFVMGFLYQIDALRHLTSLGLTIRHVHERDRLNELLCASGRTLEYLDVKVQLDHRWFPLEDVIPTGHLLPGLSSCSALKLLIFSIELHEKIGIIDDYTLFTDNPRPANLPLASWLMLVDAIDLLPSEHLTDLSLFYVLMDSPLHAPHSLLWSRLREACGRFANLQHIYVFVGEMAPLCVLFEMQEFEAMFEKDWDRIRRYYIQSRATCGNSACQRYQEKWKDRIAVI